MHVATGAVPISQLGSHGRGEATRSIRARVAEARRAQAVRFARVRGFSCNAHAPGGWIDSHGDVDDSARTLLQRAASRLSLSARSYHRVLKVARTVADLDGDRRVFDLHVSEALRYRPAAGQA